MTLTNIKTVFDRKGNPRYYFRVKGRPLIRLPSAPTDSPEFQSAWEAAREACNARNEPTPERDLYTCLTRPDCMKASE